MASLEYCFAAENSDNKSYVSFGCCYSCVIKDCVRGFLAPLQTRLHTCLAWRVLERVPKTFLSKRKPKCPVPDAKQNQRIGAEKNGCPLAYTTVIPVLPTQLPGPDHYKTGHCFQKPLKPANFVIRIGLNSLSSLGYMQAPSLPAIVQRTQLPKIRPSSLPWNGSRLNTRLWGG